ncbi:hypothetical protein GGX14DRAFT_395578 [Mycena pura]|uniref:Uncharacterized protein n=1 Tax=Mycena pura TaxID=153505 RepID=A0AAD6VEG8_9AGAR|nr:hypothetical protein GGX14DRAFT_395578 [Mycena pura]
MSQGRKSPADQAGAPDAIKKCHFELFLIANQLCRDAIQKFLGQCGAGPAPVLCLVHSLCSLARPPDSLHAHRLLAYSPVRLSAHPPPARFRPPDRLPAQPPARLPLPTERPAHPHPTACATDRLPAMATACAAKVRAVPVRAPSRAASIASEASHTSHKFTLKDLLATGPKLSRRSSARSARAIALTAAASAATAARRQRALGRRRQPRQPDAEIAIGKGATFVGRLAHKWDRSDGEKMYAVDRSHRHRQLFHSPRCMTHMVTRFCLQYMWFILSTMLRIEISQGRAAYLEPESLDNALRIAQKLYIF